jgi:hypothetical protein
MTSPNPELEQACKDYGRYIRAIFEPAMVRLKANINAGHVELHQVFGANLFVAHAVDYIQAIRNADGIKESRTDLVRKFDQTFSVNGARFSNRKFELIDAINNALKHIRLDPKRYRQLEQQYGPISFQSLVEEKGRVLCILDGYRFDYARVVLRPAYQALADWDLDAVEDVLEFASMRVNRDGSSPDSKLTLISTKSCHGYRAPIAGTVTSASGSTFMRWGPRCPSAWCAGEWCRREWG